MMGLFNTTAAATIATVALATAFLYYHRRQKLQHARQKRLDDDDNDGSQHQKIMCNFQDPLDVEKAFQAASKAVRDQQAFLLDEEKLLLYALYKQATEGDASKNAAASAWNFVERAKRHWWQKLHGMPQIVAQIKYIEAVNKLLCDDDENEEDLYDDDDNDDKKEGGGAFAPPAVSLPAVENGGYDDENDIDEKTGAVVASSRGTQLLAAASANDAKSLSYLLSSAATTMDPSITPVNVDYQDESGQSALHLAADKGSIECLKLLLDHGAQVNLQDTDGVSALQTAVIAEQLEICRMLLQHGADPNLPDSDGETPQSCAAEDGCSEMKALFGQL